MCKFVEDERNMAVQETKVDMVLGLIEHGTMSLEEIAKIAKLSVDEVKKIAESKT